MKLKEALALAVVTLSWGTIYTVSGYAIRTFPPILLYAIRFLIGGMCLLPFVKITGKEFNKIFWFGTLQALSFVFICIGLKNMDVSISAIIMRLDIPLTIFIANFIFREKITWNLALGLLVCFFAVYLINGDVKQGSGFIYILAVCFGALTSAISNIISKSISKDVSLDSTTCQGAIIIGAELFIFSLLFKEPFIEPIVNADLKAWILILYVAIVPGIFGYKCFHYTMKVLPTTQSMIFAFLRPLLNVISAFFVLGEPLSKGKILGLILTTVGIAISQINFSKKK